MSANRRKSLQQMITVDGASMISALPDIGDDVKGDFDVISKEVLDKVTEVTILQTRDVHCKIHTHD